MQDDGGRHLEKSQNRDLSVTVWPIFIKFGALMHNVSLNRSHHKKFEFHKSKMADGRHFENRLIAISLQPFERFWWHLARWRMLAPYSGATVKILNFWKFKMAASESGWTSLSMISQRVGPIPEPYTVYICQQSYLLLFGIPSPTHSFFPGLKPSFSTNLSHCSPSFLST